MYYINLINNKMIVKGGYILGTQSMRMHPTKDVCVKASDSWTRIILKVADKTFTICNTGINLVFSSQFGDNYQIDLTVNNKKYYTSRNLYEFEIDIDLDNIENFNTIVNTTDNFIYDS
jgi:hypothetical protein